MLDIVTDVNYYERLMEISGNMGNEAGRRTEKENRKREKGKGRIMYMNKNNMCMVCFKPPLDGYGNFLIKHHVSYFPEKIAFVHYDCHEKIHFSDENNHLIQYEAGDSRKFYSK